MNARSKRLNANGNAVFDIWRNDRFVATVEVDSTASRGLRVLLGALQPAGKEKAWDAIRAYQPQGQAPQLGG